MKNSKELTQMVDACIQEMQEGTTPANHFRTAMKWLKKANEAGITTDEFTEAYNSRPEVNQENDEPKALTNGSSVRQTPKPHLQEIIKKTSSRKESQWEYVATLIQDLTAGELAELASLKVNRIPDHVKSPMQITAGPDQFYLIEYRRSFYLVDTQGYEYPRYITRLASYTR